MDDDAVGGGGTLGSRPGTDGGTGAAPGAGSDLERELGQARQRIAFYEGFDRLIQENIARSGELLRQAVEQQAAAAREASAARAELDRRLAEQRQRQRTTLAALGEQVRALEVQVSALAGRVVAAFADLGAPDDAADPASIPADGSAPEPVASGEVGDAPDSAVVASPAALSEPIGIASGPDDAAADDRSAVAAPRPVAVVVHGVPRAATALSLQRHLAGLTQVETVEAREYAAGVLRLQVVARGPLALDDLRRWEGGADLEAVHVLADVIEVKLPGAAGL